MYLLYKQREYVQYAFNFFKNDHEADRSYLRDHMPFTYTFLNLLLIYLHFQILNIMDWKYSVRGVLLTLSRNKMFQMDDSEIMGVIQEKANEPVSKRNIDLDILRKP
jgi:transposase